MVEDPGSVNRRNVLRTVAGAVAGGGLAGVASGSGGSVRYNVGYDSDAAKDAAVSVADEVVHEFTFDAVTVVTTPGAAADLAARSDVRYVEEDGTMETLAQSTPWGIDRVDAEQVHAAGETGDGVDLAIIDTGIDRTHPDLQANLGSGVTIVGGLTAGDGQDDNGHGTHCAGTADGVDNAQGVVGVATQATLHPVKVLTASGSGTTSDVARGIEYTGEQGWDVGSLSLGGGGDSNVLREAVEYATGEGVLLVAAAGNDGPCTDCVGYPAAYDEVIAVSSTNRNDGLSEFSSTGPEVDIAAPGSDITSTYLAGTYQSLSGTSMACPHVSGAAAQLLANGYSPQQVRNRLTSTTEDVGLASNESGAGLLDVAAALGVDSSDD
jgi:subtilisin